MSMATEPQVTRQTLLEALRYGEKNGQDAKTLAARLGTTERAIRKLVGEMIAAGIPVCAHPDLGYFIANSEAEVESTCRFLSSRVEHTLDKIEALRAAWRGRYVAAAG
jgi:biotin operon repressor